MWYQEKIVNIYIYNSSFSFWLLNKNTRVFIELLKTNALVKSYDILV